MLSAISNPSNEPVQLATTDYERRELYRALDIRAKLANGQLYRQTYRESSGPPPYGNFPPGVRSRMIYIKLAVNDWVLCLAHHYVNADGSDYTEPDPKWIRVDDVLFKQGRSAE